MASEDRMLTGYPLGNDESRISIAELSLPKRARNALLRAGIRTLEEAIEWSDRDLLSLPHFGRASVACLRAHIGRMAESPQP
jgi:DNA-directed RNA polymerase alpha subunit